MEDIYIAMLRFGKEKMNKGSFTKNELAEHLKKVGHPVSSENSIILNQFFYQAFITHEVVNLQTAPYFLKSESYIHLLEYDSIQESSKYSKRALNIAVASIIIAVISIVVSFFNH